MPALVLPDPRRHPQHAHYGIHNRNGNELPLLSPPASASPRAHDIDLTAARGYISARCFKDTCRPDQLHLHPTSPALELPNLSSNCAFSVPTSSFTASPTPSIASCKTSQYILYHCCNMADLGDTIQLEPNSLYVCLTQLLVPGFHWSIYITDSKGTATRYHWRQVNSRQAPTDPIEEFTYNVINPITEMTRGNNLNLAFIKITAYTAPRGGSSDYFVSVFQGVFPDSYSTVRENRRNQLTCRTWVMCALEKLRAAGIINLDAATVAGLEEKIKAVGSAVETAVANGDPHTKVATM
ncbi:hypothetical protein EVG20_g884 [Dentipellis fragilis]|uniref:Uncharacterized protein n=1 Tax=Dentipellis fragilis TaxID=205917 RepID=A0A4Y9ZEE3_9AGAM|nr:hypothetical protein EVG20_g884 [Dentipellis fragilis]